MRAWMRQMRPLRSLLSTGKCLNISIPGARIRDLREKVTELTNIYKVKTLIFVGGANDMGRESANMVGRMLCDFEEEFRFEVPETRLIVSGPLPKEDNSFVKDVYRINAICFPSAIEHNYTYVYHRKFIVYDEMQLDLFSSNDYVHLNRQGFYYFAKTLKYFFYHHPKQRLPIN